MARSKRSPARLVVALSVAGLLAVFLLYTAVAGSSTPTFAPSELAGQTGKLSVTGKVVGPITGDAHSPAGLRFSLRNIKPEHGKVGTVSVVYRGSVPDMFKVGRDVNATGILQGGTLAATAMTTKCPSKYTAEEKG
ncbi:MAG TPA: cytochrome c maturation protein CcmE [Gaiellaceae bacterium]